MGYTRVNATYTTLAAGATSTATSLSVATGTGTLFAGASTANPIRCVIVDTSTTPETIKEYVDVTARSTDTLTVVREVEESTRFPKAALTSGWTIAAVETAVTLKAARAPVALTASTTTSPVTVYQDDLLTIDMDTSVTITLTASAGTWVTIAPKEDATGGRTLTIANADWGSMPPYSPSTATKRDLIVALCIDGTNWLCSTVDKGFTH